MHDITLRGYLVIFVDGFKYRYRSIVHVKQRFNGSTETIPDRAEPAIRHPVGSSQWFEDGWAVSDSKNGQLCRRDGPKKLKRFASFDEAVTFVYQRARRFRTQQHTLVYVVNERRYVVHSTDDILSVHACLDKADLDRTAVSKKDALLRALPSRVAMTAAAWRAGIDVRILFSNKATYQRHAKLLRQHGIDIEAPSNHTGCDDKSL